MIENAHTLCRPSQSTFLSPTFFLTRLPLAIDGGGLEAGSLVSSSTPPPCQESQTRTHRDRRRRGSAWLTDSLDRTPPRVVRHG